MPEPIQKGTGSHQPRQYDMKLIIDDTDYSLDLLSVRILSSLATAYQSIFLTILLDPALVIEKNIFGTSKISLTVDFMAQYEAPQVIEQVKFDLLYIKSDTIEVQKALSKITEEQTKVPFSIITVCRQPWIAMNTTVNGIYYGKTLSNIIGELVRNLGITVKIDEASLNNEVIDQVVIPPTTFYKVIKEFRDPTDPYDGYLDQRFGLYSGVPGVFCNHENKLFIKNLSGKMVMAPSFLLYHLPAGHNTKEIVDKSLQDFPRIYYTFENIKTDYSGNAKLASLSSIVRNIVKPRDTLYKEIVINMDDNAQDWSLTTQKKKLELDPDIKNTKLRYVIDDTGYEDLDTQFKTRGAQAFSDLTTMTIALERNLRLLDLMNVGECLEYIPYGFEITAVAGKYILWSSDLQFKKSGIWESTASLNLIRTNRKQSTQGESVGPLHVPIEKTEQLVSPLPQPNSFNPAPGERDPSKLSPDQLRDQELISEYNRLKTESNYRGFTKEDWKRYEQAEAEMIRRGLLTS